jgi:hypothetical protein
MILAQGCNNRGSYEAIKMRNEIECRKLPPSEYQDCVKALETDFNQYKHQREQAIKDAN